MQAIDIARETFREAREHKRLEQWHRRRARERMEELRLFCERVGIAVEYVKKETEAENGHGQEETRAR
jgi:hypothetical protein